jgi:hypothetical protein
LTGWFVWLAAPRASCMRYSCRAELRYVCVGGRVRAAADRCCWTVTGGSCMWLAVLRAWRAGVQLQG